MKATVIRKLSIAILVVVPIGLVGLGVWARFREPAAQWLESRKRKTEIERRIRERDRVLELNFRPPAALPARALDRAQYRRESFSVMFRGYDGFGVDTASGLASQDRIADPDSMFALALPDAQIDTLYEMALAGNFFRMNAPRDLPEMWSGAKHHGGEVTIRAGAEQRVFRWIPWSDRAIWSDDHKRLDRFVKTLHRMVTTHPAYLALPPPRGQYFD